MMFYNRAFCRFPPIATLIALTTLASFSSARADLSDEQKDKIRAALPSPRLSVSPSFTFSAKDGFDLKFNGKERTESKKARLDFLLRLPPPEDSAARLRYFRTVGDLQSVLSEPTAKETYDQGEKLALVLAKTGAPTTRARFLALAGEFHVDQGEYNEAQSAVDESFKLAPDTAEAWDVKAQLLFQRISNILGSETSSVAALESWIDTKPTPETEKTVAESVVGALEAVNKAITLHEKNFPRPKDRAPDLYFSRILYWSCDNALRSTIAGRKGEKPRSFAQHYNDNRKREEMVRDLGNAAACEPDNPYAIIAHRISRVMKAGSVKATDQESKIALAELAALERRSLPDRESRVRLLEAQAIFSAMTDDWPTVVKKSKRGLEISPTRETFVTFYAAGLGKQKKYAEAEVFMAGQVSRNDTTINRLMLAKTQIEQNDLVGAERTLVPLYERDKSSASPAIFLSTVRLKATSANTTEADWQELRDLIKKIDDDYEDNTTREEGLSFYLAVATLYALDDEVKDAKEMLQNILDADKDNEAAKEMLALLP